MARTLAPAVLDRVIGLTRESASTGVGVRVLGVVFAARAKKCVAEAGIKLGSGAAQNVEPQFHRPLGDTMPSMMPDRVSVIKKRGQRFEDLKANVQPTMIFIDDPRDELPLEEGDHIERTLKNGLKEQYLVLDRGYYPGERRGFPSHYQAKVRKVTRIELERRPTIVYNLSGHGSRVNIQSHDASVNIVNVTTDNLFDQLRSAIETGIQDGEERRALLTGVSQLEETRGRSQYLSAYQEFIATAANHMTLLAPFIPALTQLLPTG